MKHPLRRLSTDERGAAAVEFALISTVLFMLVFGIIQFGHFYSKFQVFQGAAREGARVAAVADHSMSSAEVRTLVSQRIVDSAGPFASGELGERSETDLDIAALTISPSQCTDASVGDAITVSWDQGFEITMPLVPSIDFTSDIKGVFRCE